MLREVFTIIDPNALFINELKFVLCNTDGILANIYINTQSSEVSSGEGGEFVTVERETQFMQECTHELKLFLCLGFRYDHNIVIYVAVEYNTCFSYYISY